MLVLSQASTAYRPDLAHKEKQWCQPWHDEETRNQQRMVCLQHKWWLLCHSLPLGSVSTPCTLRKMHMQSTDMQDRVAVQEFKLP